MTTEFYHFIECGLDNVYLVNGVTNEETAQGAVLKIHDLDGLLRAIREHLVFKKRTLNGREIRFLRHELDLSQRELAVLLDVDEQTVTHWEKGETKIDGAAARLIRIMCAEQSKGSCKVQELLEHFAKLDDDGFAALHMRATDEGWRPVQTAAART